MVLWTEQGIQAKLSVAEKADENTACRWNMPLNVFLVCRGFTPTPARPLKGAGAGGGGKEILSAGSPSGIIGKK